jgi:hypothetical protein
LSSSTSSSSTSSSREKAAGDHVADLLVNFNDLTVSDNETLYPTKAAPVSSLVDQHRQLLTHISGWINTIYQKNASGGDLKVES